MVFAINPPASGNTFDAFKAKAIQQGSSDNSTNSGSNILNVDVGPTGQLVFQPPFVQAKKGDLVRFKLYVLLFVEIAFCSSADARFLHCYSHPKAHSVTQSSFDTPCTNANLFDTQL